MASHLFKKCNVCNHEWQDRDSFILDPAIKLVGYQAYPDNLNRGLYLFNHDCGTTLVIHVENFLDLYKGPIYSLSMSGNDECPGYCRIENELSDCGLECSCVHFRKIMSIMLSMKKSSSR